jgi:uncharacterized membrane protein YgcG
MRLRFPRRWLLLGAVAGFGCYSPTLPLPPPVKPDITMTDTGAYHVHGGVLPDAQVFMLNARTLLMDGQQSDHVGIYDFDLHNAEAGDMISVWYEVGTDLSPTTAFDLPDLSTKNGTGGTGGSGGSSGSSGSGGSGGSGG